MIVDEEEAEALRKVARGHAAFIRWLRKWADEEIRGLLTTRDDLERRQGRCQALNELLQKLEEVSNE